MRQGWCKIRARAVGCGLHVPAGPRAPGGPGEGLATGHQAWEIPSRGDKYWESDITTGFGKQTTGASRLTHLTKKILLWHLQRKRLLFFIRRQTTCPLHVTINRWQTIKEFPELIVTHPFATLTFKRTVSENLHNKKIRGKGLEGGS